MISSYTTLIQSQSERRWQKIDDYIICFVIYGCVWISAVPECTAGCHQHDKVNKSDCKLLYDTRSQQEEWTAKRNWACCRTYKYVWRLARVAFFWGGDVLGGQPRWGKWGWVPWTKRTPTSSPFFLLFYYSQTLAALKTLMRLLKFIVCSLAKYMKWKYISRTCTE